MKIPAKVNQISEIKKIFESLSGGCRVVGVGVSAFQRSGLGYILPNYEILSLLETADLPAIRQVCPVTVIPGERPQELNTSSILSLNWVKDWLGRRQKTNLFVYKAATPLDEIIKTLPTCAGRPVKLLSSPGYIRKPLEDKKVFRVEACKAGIQIPAGLNLNLEQLTETKWDQLKQKYGERLVFQLTDYSTGGGQGTFFINNRDDWQKFWEFTRSQDRKKELKFVNVCERVAGRSASITGCATRYGVVTSLLQTQIIDQPELVGFKGRNGVWLGHDWTARFSDKAQLNAEKLCQKWGEYIYQKGYKGIFGLDVVLGENDEITVIECNSRYTGAFPVYTMLQLAQGEMPLDVWHLLEWLGLDYELDLDEVQRISRLPKAGSHIIMHSLADKPVKAGGAVKAGVWGIRPINSAKKFKDMGAFAPVIDIGWAREGFSLLDIKADDEFVLCDRIPNPGQIIKPGERIGKLIFKRRIIDDEGNLLPEIKAVVASILTYYNM